MRFWGTTASSSVANAPSLHVPTRAPTQSPTDDTVDGNNVPIHKKRRKKKKKRSSRRHKTVDDVPAAADPNSANAFVPKKRRRRKTDQDTAITSTTDGILARHHQSQGTKRRRRRANSITQSINKRDDDDDESVANPLQKRKLKRKTRKLNDGAVEASSKGTLEQLETEARPQIITKIPLKRKRRRKAAPHGTRRRARKRKKTNSLPIPSESTTTITTVQEPEPAVSSGEAESIIAPQPAFVLPTEHDKESFESAQTNVETAESVDQIAKTIANDGAEDEQTEILPKSTLVATSSDDTSNYKEDATVSLVEEIRIEAVGVANFEWDDSKEETADVATSAKDHPNEHVAEDIATDLEGQIEEDAVEVEGDEDASEIVITPPATPVSSDEGTSLPNTLQPNLPHSWRDQLKSTNTSVTEDKLEETVTHQLLHTMSTTGSETLVDNSDTNTAQPLDGEGRIFMNISLADIQVHNTLETLDNISDSESKNEDATNETTKTDSSASHSGVAFVEETVVAGGVGLSKDGGVDVEKSDDDEDDDETSSESDTTDGIAGKAEEEPARLAAEHQSASPVSDAKLSTDAGADDDDKTGNDETEQAEEKPVDGESDAREDPTTDSDSREVANVKPSSSLDQSDSDTSDDDDDNDNSRKGENGPITQETGPDSVIDSTSSLTPEIKVPADAKEEDSDASDSDEPHSPESKIDIDTTGLYKAPEPTVDSKTDDSSDDENGPNEKVSVFSSVIANSQSTNQSVTEHEAFAGDSNLHKDKDDSVDSDGNAETKEDVDSTKKDDDSSKTDNTDTEVGSEVLSKPAGQDEDISLEVEPAADIGDKANTSIHEPSTLDLDTLGCTTDEASDITVSCITWNLAEESPSEDEAEFIKRFRRFGDDRENGSDLVLIGCQECENIKPRRTEGRRSREIRRLMIKMLGRKYIPIAIHSLGGIQFSLFCRSDRLDDVEEISLGDVTCGIGNVFHNKGAIAAFVKMRAQPKTAANGKETSKSLKMLFVTAHMAAHVKNVEARDGDFWRIFSELETQAPPGFLSKKRSNNNDDSSGVVLLDSVDRIFFCGDLNYRLELPREEAEFAVHQIKSLMTGGDSHEADRIRLSLLRHDQLLHTIAEERAFPGFAEGRITFPPTFKFDKDSLEEYDTSHKQRIPAWTDRVLYKPQGTRVLEYNWIPNARHSDHRPVYATFRVSMSGREMPSRKQPRSRRRSSRRKSATRKE